MIFFIFILGLFIGSFLLVLADRLPKGENVLWGRSHCQYCRHMLRWYELIPLLSYIFQKGKSRCCQKTLSIRYPLCELATGAGFAMIYSLQPSAFSYQTPSVLSIMHFGLCLVLFSCFLVIFFADLQYEIIPMEMVVIGCIAASMIHILTGATGPSLLNSLLSAFGTGLFFFCLWFFSKGRAMGEGDIYLSALIGWIVGFPNIIISMYASFLTGAAAGIILILIRKKTMKAHIPFGPFLIFGCAVALIWGQAILALWRQL